MVFTTRPRKVSTLGLIRARASQRTMASSSTPQARPKALVQVALIDFSSRPSSELSSQVSSLGFRLVVDGSEVQNFHIAVALRGDDDRAVSDFLVEQGASNRRTGRYFSGGYVRLFAVHQLVLDFRVLRIVIDPNR